MSNSRDMSRVDISYTPSFDSNTAFMPKQSFTPASYHSSPATQFPQPRTTTPEHTASLACLDVGVSQSFHNAGTQQVQSYGVQSSPPAGLPVNRSSIADPSTGSRYSYPPIPGLSQNVGAMSATSMAANGPTVTSPDSARDQTLAELANAIGNASGTTNMTEKARINFVHGW